MEELNKSEKEDTLLGWGTASALLAKAGDLAEAMGRDDIINMLSDSFDLMESEKDASKIFFNVYQYAWRVYFRMKSLNKDMPINRVTLENRNHEEVYVVSNYDYKMFLWAKSKGYTKTLTNNEFVVEPESLTPAEKRRFEKQAEK
jgi:hypothetical protein